jgi:hypothetical protein
LTLFRARGERQRAIFTGKQLLEHRAAEIVWVRQSDFDEAWQVYRRFDDKGWSFVDCSYAVIKRLSIKRAFAFDEHFRQFGDIEVYP